MQRAANGHRYLDPALDHEADIGDAAQICSEHEVEEKLAALGVPEPTVTVELMSVIERLPSGKLQRFVPRRGDTTQRD